MSERVQALRHFFFPGGIKDPQGQTLGTLGTTSVSPGQKRRRSQKGEIGGIFALGGRNVEFHPTPQWSRKFASNGVFIPPLALSTGVTLPWDHLSVPGCSCLILWAG